MCVVYWQVTLMRRLGLRKNSIISLNIFHEREKRGFCRITHKYNDKSWKMFWIDFHLFAANMKFMRGSLSAISYLVLTECNNSAARCLHSFELFMPNCIWETSILQCRWITAYHSECWWVLALFETDTGIDVGWERMISIAGPNAAHLLLSACWDHFYRHEITLLEPVRFSNGSDGKIRDCECGDWGLRCRSSQGNSCLFRLNHFVARSLEIKIHTLIFRNSELAIIWVKVICECAIPLEMAQLWINFKWPAKW